MTNRPARKNVQGDYHYRYSTIILDTQFVEHLNQALVKTLVRTDTLREGNIYHFVIADTYHDVALSLLDSLNSSHTHATCQDAVARRRRAATL